MAGADFAAPGRGLPFVVGLAAAADAVGAAGWSATTLDDGADGNVIDAAGGGGANDTAAGATGLT